MPSKEFIDYVKKLNTPLEIKDDGRITVVDA